MTDRTRFILPSPLECAELDRRASRTMPIVGLMESAGWAVARVIRQRYRPCRVLVLCGPGNNGGDGYVAARLLAQAGWPVAVAALSSPKQGSPASVVAEAWRGPLVAFDPAEVARADLVVDAVFGAGLNRRPDEQVVAALTAAREIVAIDILSGVDGGSGNALPDLPKASVTVTFVRPKPGHLLMPGALLVGELVCADLGMPSQLLNELDVQTWHNMPGLWKVPAMTVSSHKYSRGVVSICAGGKMPGAARLSAAAARAAGAGVVRVSAGAYAEAYRLGAPGLIVDDAPLVSLLEDERRKVWICGPGLTLDEVAASLPILTNAGRLVLADAGALSWAAQDLRRLSGVTAITPHFGEFSRLFGDPGHDRLSAAREAALRIGAVVVLKGPDTIIAAPDGRAAINDHASPSLATAGSGDTLSGIIGAMMAAGMPTWEACCAGVWIHGEAGIRAGEWPIAEKLDDHLGAARAKAAGLGCEDQIVDVKARP